MNGALFLVSGVSLLIVGQAVANMANGVRIAACNRRAFVLYQLWRHFDADNSGVDRTCAFSLS